MKARLPKGYGSQGSQQQMMKKVQQMQQDMTALQDELAEREFSATAGGGMVTATVTGEKKLVSLKIDPQVVDPEDVEMLQDLILAAVNEASATADKTSEEEMAKITGGMNLPGLF